MGITITVLLWGDTSANHRDAFDTGWKSAAAVLAILAAFVTVERLRLSQREHRRQLANDEATHITTLSSKASEQLGSEKAAVRIGGLTDLERLAEQYPSLRQTVVDRICAYLRAPYQLPPGRVILAAGAEPASSDTSAGDPEPSDEEIAARRLELDVRRTAQQILLRHLRSSETSPHAFWKKISLDLRDAVLIEVDFRNCRIASADFRNATLHSYSWFEGVTFAGDAWFGEVTFAGDAEFRGAMFAGDAWFGGATFTRDADFSEVTFTGNAWFRAAMFAGGADLSGATFIGNAGFGEVTFTGDTEFSGAMFTGGAWFGGAAFAGDVEFRGVTFTGNAWFRGATFAREAEFGGVTFTGDAGFGEVTFVGDAGFGGVTFTGDALFRGAAYKAEISFDNARVISPNRKHIWPRGWCVETIPHGPGSEARLVRSPGA
ncbi:pentapeptide repeat-containing protein [Amycolatopsis sp. NBC_00345]|uniref:pentapeptide repeat-containing protein n=1 Tax=Amycolatopsis sp. NBC_00345 TaxID=2975955 RepID=UPI002E2629CA